MIQFNEKESEVYPSRSRTMEITEGVYKGVKVYRRYTNPHFWAKKPSLWYSIDLVLPYSEGWNNLSEDFYTMEGYGVPVVDTEDEAVQYIEDYLRKQKEVES